MFLISQYSALKSIVVPADPLLIPGGGGGSSVACDYNEHLEGSFLNSPQMVLFLFEILTFYSLCILTLILIFFFKIFIKGVYHNYWDSAPHPT